MDDSRLTFRENELYINAWTVRTADFGEILCRRLLRVNTLLPVFLRDSLLPMLHSAKFDLFDRNTLLLFNNYHQNSEFHLTLPEQYW